MTDRLGRPSEPARRDGQETPTAVAVSAPRASRAAGELADMGERLRASRRERGMSLRDLAARVGLSPSLISQVETGRATPSVATLFALAEELQVSVDDILFGARSPRAGARPSGADGAASQDSGAGAVPIGPVQRSSDRKSIRLASGVTWERLTPTSEGDVEFLFVTYEVGGASSPHDAFQRHPGHEWGYVLSGRLHVTIAFDDYVLEAGDSISIDSSLPHRLWNDGQEPVHAIWFDIGRHRRDPRFEKTGGSA